MTEKKKLTINDLIKNKEEIAKKKTQTKELYVEELDATVTIERPDRSLIMDSMDIAENKNSDSNGDDFIVYNIVTEPNLKDDELQKAFNCKEPMDIVYSIFGPGSVTSIAMQGMELAGYNSKVTPVDDIKNS